MRITVHIPAHLGSLVKVAASDQGLSVSALTAEALELYLERKHRKTAGNRLLQLVRAGAVPATAWEELEKGRVDDRP